MVHKGKYVLSFQMAAMKEERHMTKAEALAQHVNIDGGTALSFAETLPPNEEMSWRDSPKKPTVNGITYLLTQVRFDDGSTAFLALGQDRSEIVHLTEWELGAWVVAGQIGDTAH